MFISHILKKIYLIPTLIYIYIYFSMFCRKIKEFFEQTNLRKIDFIIFKRFHFKRIQDCSLKKKIDLKHIYIYIYILRKIKSSLSDWFECFSFLSLLYFRKFFYYNEPIRMFFFIWRKIIWFFYRFFFS